MKTIVRCFHRVLFCPLILTVLGTANRADAALITDLSASSKSYLGINILNAIEAVNGSGFSDPNHVNVQGLGPSGTPPYTMWVGNTNSINGEYITIDLKKNYELLSTGTLKVWNYNLNAGGETDRGMKNATFSYKADDGGPVLIGLDTLTGFTSLGSVTTDAAAFTFDQANGLSVGTNFNIVDFNESVVARYIRITVAGGQNIGNYNDAQYVGLSEVQVFTVIPEPSSLLLLGLGMYCLVPLTRRRRRRE